MWLRIYEYGRVSVHASIRPSIRPSIRRFVDSTLFLNDELRYFEGEKFVKDFTIDYTIGVDEEVTTDVSIQPNAVNIDI